MSRKQSCRSPRSHTPIGSSHTQTSHPTPPTPHHTLGPSLQVWLLLNNLLVDPKARAKYDMDEYRKEAVLRVRRYLNDILLDQLPILRDLQRVLDELTMGVSSQPDESQTTRLIIEQVLLCLKAMSQ